MVDPSDPGVHVVDPSDALGVHAGVHVGVLYSDPGVQESQDGGWENHEAVPGDLGVACHASPSWGHGEGSHAWEETGSRGEIPACQKSIESFR